MPISVMSRVEALLRACCFQDAVQVIIQATGPQCEWSDLLVLGSRFEVKVRLQAVIVQGSIR